MSVSNEPGPVPAIRIADVKADYGQGPVIEDITFDVRMGETFGLIGLNGVGKTTLIKIILGLMEASAGSVQLFGKKSLDPEGKSKIAYLPEKFEPPPFLSGLEFVRFSLDLYKRPFQEEAVMQAADRISLTRAALKRRVNTYSKGMRQKTGLMGTWLTGCPLLILDEPMSGLDPLARVLVKDEIAACRKAGMTVFLSSHILSDMEEICDRVAIIHDGRLKFTGTPAELKQNTQQEYLERAFLKIIEGSKRIYES
ncbi:MAG TPA: ABC transporter ATP-binding protein [Patescibacteria group bacterium]|nr:ABC transporter ATP-binding protein [Patescibacteria group bacterium]